MRRFLYALLALVVLACVAAAVAAVQYRPDRAIRVATEFIAHTLCSATFVSNLDPDQVYREALRPTPGIRLLNRGIRYNVDKLRKEVSVDFLRNFDGYAVFRGETGCIVAHEGEYIPPIMDPARNEQIAAILPDIAGPEVVAPKNEKLKAALDHAFAEPDRGPRRWTKAVVVLHNGKIIAERYAPEIGVDTRLPGYSMSKSVVNAFVGILVRQGKLKTDGPAPVGEWKEASDPRHAISIENLMRMTSGLDLDETNTGFDPSSQILSLEGNMAEAAARAPLKALPGMRWHYSSPSTLILSRIVKNALGPPENVEQFARRELFGPLGMTTMTLEFDGAGTPVGSTFFFGSARDWARFGQLFLLDGMVEGKRILPEGWVNWSAAPTVEANVGYGAGFWTNRGDSRGAQARVKMGFPSDSFMASGSLGQRIMIVPSANLVVVRMGFSQDHPNFDIQGAARLVTDVMSAIDDGS
jgi:CubicO group peptidase (beta-lactamase class C family)